MKKMVITGVNGFIGRHAKEYFEKEYEITGLDLAANYCGDRQPGDTMTYYQCNMSQESAEMAAIFTGVQPDVILHCAGSANVGASVVNPMADLDGNLHSLYQLLLALKSFEKDRRSFSSRVQESTAIRDSFRCASQTLRRRCPPMGCTSTWRRKLCEYYNRIHGYRIRSIRIFSAYGNGLRKQLLWDIYQKYQNTGRIELFGTGEETRDFIHVSDIVRAIELILAYDGPENVINVANGEEVSIRELAEIYAGKLGADADVVSFNGMVKEATRATGERISPC